MHEISLMQNVLEQVTALGKSGVFTGRLVAVHLKVGRLNAVIPDQLAFAWEVLTHETAWEGARLEIHDVPVRARCNACGAEDEMAEIGFLCARCGSTDVDVRSGRELLIDSLEVEDG